MPDHGKTILETMDDNPDSYTEGYLAHDNGTPASKNPYPDDDPDNIVWAEGWADAEADDVEVASIMGDDPSDEELDRQTSKDLDTLSI